MNKNTAIFALSSDIDANLKLKVLSIEGQFKQLYSQSLRISNPQLYQHLSKIKYTSDLFLTVQLFNENVPLTLPVQTTYVSFDNNDGDRGVSIGTVTSSSPAGPNGAIRGGGGEGNGGKIRASNNSYRRNFNQWLNLPINYSQLPFNSKLVFKIFEFVNNKQQPFGECEVRLFSEHNGTLQRGHQLLQIKLDKRLQVDNGNSADNEKYQEQLNEIEAIIKKFEAINHDSTDSWLNSLIIKKIEKLNKKLIQKNLDNFNLYIELVNFDVNIIYNDFVYTKKNYSALKTTNGAINNINESYLASRNNSLNNSMLIDNRTYDARRNKIGFNNVNNNNKPIGELIDVDSVNQNAKYPTFKIYDPEQYNNQPIELKYHQLERSSLNNTNYKKLTDKNLKPNLKLKKNLNTILNYSSIRKLDNFERNLIYKFRYYLINNFKLNSSLNSNFLNFLLKSINWENNNEIIEIQEILGSLMINKLKISLTNTLELLGPIFANNTLVRNFAVNNLKYFNDMEINLYLLQLIQALKFDDYIFDTSYSNSNSINFKNLNTSNDFSMVDISSKEELSTFYKNLKYNKNSGPIDNNNNSNYILSNNSTNINEAVSQQESATESAKYYLEDSLSPLANFLIYKAIHNKLLGNFFYWYVKIESKDLENDFKSQLIFRKILKVFLKQLKVLDKIKQEINRRKERRNKIDVRLISRNNSMESDINEMDSSEEQEATSNRASESSIINNNNDNSNTNFNDAEGEEATDYYKTIKDNVNKIFDTRGSQQSSGAANNANNNDNADQTNADLTAEQQITNKNFNNVELTGSELESSELMEQINFVKVISQLTVHIKNLKKSTVEKQEYLKTYLQKNESDYKYFNPKNKESLILPLNPRVRILSIIPEQCTVFKSSLSPLKLTFKIQKEGAWRGDLENGNNYDDSQYQEGIENDEEEDAINRSEKYGLTYSFMYKVGDDLRQDQLIIQIIKLIEKLLQDENLNLKLNPYRILSTGLNEGMIEFVPNLTVDKILNQYSSILNFFKTENPFGGLSKNEQQSSNNKKKKTSSKAQAVVEDIGDVVLNTDTNLETNLAEAIHNNSDAGGATGAGNNAVTHAVASTNNNNLNLDGIHPKIMDNFVKSCAGYCVITYLLGIGDRHLDNLLICNNGKFFHVDFGYILGRDPKPFPPLMKLPIEIIEGFGGLNSQFFIEFKNYCYICFLTLRKNSNLILNLLELMTHCNIPDLKIDSKNAILKVQDKFMLNLNDEEAIVYFQNLINDSVNAFLPVVIDKLHSLAQYWRA